LKACGYSKSNSYQNSSQKNSKNKNNDEDDVDKRRRKRRRRRRRGSSPAAACPPLPVIPHAAALEAPLSVGAAACACVYSQLWQVFVLDILA
jgi:hypothetical protein